MDDDDIDLDDDNDRTERKNGLMCQWLETLERNRERMKNCVSIRTADVIQ